MKNIPLALAAVLSLLPASAAFADENADRHAKLDKTAPFVLKFCDTVDKWRIDSEMTAAARKAAGVKMIEKDLEADWPDQQKDKVRGQVKGIREHCSALRDAKAGLPALTAKGAALGKVDAKDWETLSDKLDEILETYQGRNNRPKHYKNFYGNTDKNKHFKSVYQLSEDASKILSEMADALAAAVKAARAP